ncbi:MAG: PAQR family membrane homeostasis protein TrhA [Syntrophomonadaceae bacterium]|jgi:hemolysin III
MPQSIIKPVPAHHKLKDPFSGLSHLIGALFSVAGLWVLVYYAGRYATVKHIVTFAIFGAALILLYSASALYHLLNVSEKKNLILRRIDHMMIYVLIAGTYTPICIIALPKVWGLSLLVSIWVLALIGIILTLIWFSAPRWFTTAIYILMGWMVVVAFLPLMQSLPAAGLGWLVGGGVAYTVGAVIYGTKWPPLTSSWFGFHEIFHLFVIAGSVAHYWLMLRYVLFI